MDVSGKLHAPAAFTPGKKVQCPRKASLIWLQRHLDIVEKIKSVVPYGNLFCSSPAFNLVTLLRIIGSICPRTMNAVLIEYSEISNYSSRALGS
jgi:hypothetical protein